MPKPMFIMVSLIHFPVLPTFYGHFRLRFVCVRLEGICEIMS